MYIGVTEGINMHDFTKVYRIGTSETSNGKYYSIFVKAEYKNEKLSLTGVEGPTPNGNCIGSCGQIVMDMDIDKITPAKGWSKKSIKRLMDIWNEWHLNNMQAGCEHQRANWNPSEKIEIDGETKTARWIHPYEHPRGLLTKPCKICGYKYGTKWLHKDVPNEVLQELINFPGTDTKPAWI